MWVTCWLGGVALAVGCGGEPDPLEDADAGGTDAGEIAVDAGVPVDVGAECEAQSDCPGGVCVRTGPGGSPRCTIACESDEVCLPGWMCHPWGGDAPPTVCRCTAEDEVCGNGLDDDCDGRVDQGDETCDGEDEDCDGVVDEELSTCGCAPGGAGPRDELCDLVDDDCDGRVDEGYDLSTDPGNCGACGNACGGVGFCSEARCCPDAADRPLDVLFVVRSISQLTERLFALEIPALVRALASGDVGGDGAREHVRATDVHFGVVTSNMGSGGYPGCGGPDFGLDGLLRDAGAGPACSAAGDLYLETGPGDGVADLDALAAELACRIDSRPTGSCIFDQPLEAALKALTPSTSAVRFFRSTTGHGDGANAGFLRPDSVLAVVVVTNENDCSVSDPELFDATSTRYDTDFNIRCASYPDALHPLERYRDGLLALRSDPDDVILSVVAGVPDDLLSDPLDFPAIISDPRMQERIGATQIMASCGTSFFGDISYPPTRLVGVAQQIDTAGAGVSVGSSCTGDFSTAAMAIADRIGSRLDGACVAP